MIPICLVTGFLGSGKTTLLKRIVASNRGGERQLVYLVNEFSPIDVDSSLIECLPEELVSISGGSIFCHCKVSDFQAAMEGLATAAAQGRRIDGLVIEATGMADPGVFVQMLDDTKLNAHFTLSSIITVVDPGNIRKLLLTLPNTRQQLAAAGTVLINKTDVNEPSYIKKAEAATRDVNPDASLIRTVRCETDLDLFACGVGREMAGEFAKCADPNYARFEFAQEGVLDIDTLRSALRAHRGDVYRLKGYARTRDGLAYVDYSSSGFDAQPRPDGREPAGLIAITRGGRQQTVRAALLGAMID